jgi:quinoprotein dehydrogenase-associated probable ABC transporter substrate-binding protein
MRVSSQLSIALRALTALAVLVVLALRGAEAQVPAAERRPLPPLRVCADPNNLPFTNDRGEGFENEIAELVARDLGTTLEYVWRPQRRGFVRTTLNEGRCDLIMGVPVGYDPVRTTRPYYRSTYVFVQRADAPVRVTSLADSALSRLRVGIHVVGDENPPAMTALARRGIIDNVEGYSIYGDYSEPNPPARLIEAVAKGDVDVAIAWGPLVGYFATRQSVPLIVAPVPASSDPSGQSWTFPIAMGMRRSSTALAGALDRILVADAPSIHEILVRYGVPLLPIEVGTMRRPRSGTARH